MPNYTDSCQSIMYRSHLNKKCKCTTSVKNIISSVHFEIQNVTGSEFVISKLIKITITFHICVFLYYTTSFIQVRSVYRQGKNRLTSPQSYSQDQLILRNSFKIFERIQSDAKKDYTRPVREFLLLTKGSPQIL